MLEWKCYIRFIFNWYWVQRFCWIFFFYFLPWTDRSYFILAKTFHILHLYICFCFVNSWGACGLEPILTGVPIFVCRYQSELFLTCVEVWSQIIEQLTTSNKACLFIFSRDISNLYKNVPSTVSGWGVTSVGQETPANTLREAQVIAHANSNCGLVTKVMTDRMICASKWGRDSCSGDSGGELVGAIRTQYNHVYWLSLLY